MPRQICLIIFLLASIALPTTLLAEYNNTFPRSRLLADVAYSGQKTGSARMLGRSSDRQYSVDTTDAFDLMPLVGGVAASYTSQYLWREFLMSDQGANFALDGYIGMYGFEASIFSLSDFSGDYDHSGPLVTEYRVGYTYKVATSLTSISYTLGDWDNSASKLGTKKNGFNPELLNGFVRETNEITISSHWFNDLIQSDGMNFMLGNDTTFDIDNSGLHSQLVVGIFTNKPGNVDIFHPNAARLSATLIYQSNYYTDISDIIGSNFFLEMGWDLRQVETPLLITLDVEYFLPWNASDFTERLIVRGRIEVPF